MFEVEIVKDKKSSHYRHIDNNSLKHWVCPNEGCLATHTSKFANVSHCNTCEKSMPRVMDLINSERYRLRFHLAGKGVFRL